MARRNGLALAFLFLVLLMAIASSQTRRASALGVINDVFNPGFEDTNSNFWFVTATYGGGTVNINDVSNSHSGSYSAMLNGVNTTLQCSGPECKDTVRATVEQYVQFNQPPTLSNLAETNNSFSAWWFVADPSSTGVPTYSLHIGLVFSDGQSIEYFYGISDLSNQRYNLGPIPATTSWFHMQRNLLADIQGVVTNPASTRITTIWFSAFGGTVQSAPHGEKAWIDDVALSFNSGPIAIFSSSRASGPAPLLVRFDATHSYVIGGPNAASSIASYTWSFGDGSPQVTIATPITSHIYGGSGTFQVTLIVTDSNGENSNLLTSTVTVDPGDVTLPIVLAGGGGLLLVGGLFFTKFRRRSPRVKKPKHQFRKG